MANRILRQKSLGEIKLIIVSLQSCSYKLNVIPSEPPERHADITGWPEESKQKQIALESADEAPFHNK